MKDHPLLKTVSVTAAVSSMIQASLWILICLTHFLFYSEAFEVDDTDLYPSETYGHGLQKFLFHNYVRRDKVIIEELKKTDFIFNAHSMVVVTSLYFFLSVLWFYFSYSLYFVARNKQMYNHLTVPIVWYSLTIIILLVDFIITLCLMQDLGAASSFALSCKDCSMMPVAVAAVACFTARGFTLWIINLLFVCSIIHLLFYTYDERKRRDRNRSVVVESLNSRPMVLPRAKLSTFLHRIRNPHEWWVWDDGYTTDTTSSSSSSSPPSSPQNAVFQRQSTYRN